ncbi:MAG: T9SS type A sorting domain-containing protein [Saprospiraceae bacterium]|nr:T9SS type A sorting domain-containing protein [Lewinella sp.]
MKHLLLCLFFVSVIGATQAQRLVFVEAMSQRDIHVEDVSDFDQEIRFTVRLTNMSHDTLEIKWEKQIFKQPEEWITQVNDQNGIYLPNVSSNFGLIPGIESPVVIAPGEYTEVTMNVMPMGTLGEGWYKLDFAYADAPGYSLESFEFKVHSGNPDSIYTTSRSEITVYPNPAIDYFEITPNTLVDRVEIINVVGGKVRSYHYEHGQKYSISNLPSGLYMVSLVNEKTGVIKTMRLLKRTIRS